MRPPLEMQLVEIVPEGLDQKTDAQQRIPGKLERAINIEFDKTGALNMRRGYQRAALGTAIGAPAGIVDEVFLNAGTYDDELLLFGYDYLYALGSRASTLGGTRRYIYRGPLNRGTVRLQHVAVSGLTDEANPFDLTQRAVFAGHDQADVASLVVDGHCYRCYVYRNAARNRVDAVCFVELEHGQDVVVFRNTVVQGDESGVPTTGTRVDCPKIIAVGSTFAVHWLEATVLAGSVDTQALWRATIDLTTIDTSTAWTSQGAIDTHIDALYDAQPVEGTTDEFIVVHKHVDGTDVQVRRHNGFGWGNTVWVQLASVTIQARVLCCSCTASDGDVSFSYAVGGQLRTGRVTYTTGLAFLDQQTFVVCPFNEWSQAAHVRVLDANGGTTAVFAEGWGANVGETPGSSPTSYHHGVAYRRIRTDAATRTGTEHWTLNLALASRPFRYQSARTLAAGELAPNVYVAVSFKSVGSAEASLGTWDQRSYFLCNSDFAHWDLFTAGTCRLRPIANLGSNGSADARVSGATPAPVGDVVLFTKRMNHVSSASGAPVVGPDVKSRTIAAVIFSRITLRRIDDVAFSSSVAEFIPTSAGVVGYRLHLEEPWVRYRDGSDPAEPSTNYHGAYPWTQYQTVKAGRCGFISGGAPAVYDGHAIVEAGFPWYPEITDITSFTGTGGMEAGVRYWCATYEWRDSAGQVHRSRPSRPVRFEVVDDSDNVQLSIRCCNLSLKDSPHFPNNGPVNIVVWRTEVDGQIFYRLHGSDSAPYRIEDTPINDPLAYQIQIEDLRPDGSGLTLDLARSDQLPYNFANGVSSSFLPVRPPAAHACCVWQGRVWLASSEDPRELWYSAEILPAPGDTYAVAPEFHFENRFTLPELGEVVALQPLEDELVVFTRDGIYKLIGQGNSLGTTDATYQLSVIHEGTGCVNPRSLVLGPPGVFFQSAKGIYLYGRSRELDYLSAGASIEDDIRAAGLIRSATILEDRHQIRFVGNSSPTGTPRVWIYDYFHRLWSRADLTPMSSDLRSAALNGGCAWRGATGEQLHVVCAQGGLMIERAAADAAAFADETAAGTTTGYGIDVALSWIHLGGVAGMHRIREIGVQATKVTPGPLFLEASYDVLGDYPSAIVETFDLSSPAPGFMKAKPRVQKMSAIYLRLHEGIGVLSPGQRLSIKAFVLYAAVKPSPRKVPTSQIGT